MFYRLPLRSGVRNFSEIFLSIMQSIRKIKYKRIIQFFCLTTLAISPLIPDSNFIIPRIDPLIQNILHIPVFAGLSILLFLILIEYRVSQSKSITLIASILLILSILTEIADCLFIWALFFCLA